MVDFTTLCTLDVETTGLHPTRGDRVVEIACVGEYGLWHTLIHPMRPVPKTAQAIHHITTDMVAQAPEFSEIAAELFSLLHGKIVVGHHVMFDLGFLAHEFSLAHHDMPSGRMLDTLSLAEAMGMGRPALGAFARQLSLSPPTSPAHRASTDAHLTQDCLLAALKRMGQERVMAHAKPFGATSFIRSRS